jgi:predicted DNA-binding transcriptional regulator AlpA
LVGFAREATFLSIKMINFIDCGLFGQYRVWPVLAGNARMNEQISMDADRRILQIVQHDASLSVREISAKVGLSRTSCWRRLQRLDAAGVIKRRIALLDPRKLGLGVTVFVSVEVAGFIAWQATPTMDCALSSLTWPRSTLFTNAWSRRRRSKA